jgi:hypothetical protein
MQSTGHANGNGTSRARARTGRAVFAALISLLAVVGVASPADAATAVKISRIYYNSPGTDNWSTSSLNAEYVNLLNLTGVTQVITRWTIRDAQGHVYTFPTTSIPAHGTVTLHTGKGVNSGNQRYWQSGAYIWNNDRDTAYLRNAAGAAIFTCSYNSTAVAYKNC